MELDLPRLQRAIEKANGKLEKRKQKQEEALQKVTFFLLFICL
jgi:hypothetical protein